MTVIGRMYFIEKLVRAAQLPAGDLPEDDPNNRGDK
jgi:hypothetical protein